MLVEKTSLIKPLTKLVMPIIPKELLERPRLHLHFQEALSNKVILVTAPAGYGKTIFLSEVLSNITHRPIAWLSLDKRDNNAITFWTSFIVALQKAKPGIGKYTLNMLETGNTDIDSALIALSNEISRDIPNLIVVLDDYHEINNQTIYSSLTFLINCLALPVCFVISGRTKPALPLAQLRCYGHIANIETADLQFTHDETRDFLNRIMGLSFSSEDIDIIQNRIEGWIAGLQMMALSIRKHPDTAEFITNIKGTNRNIMEYLSREVLEQQEEYIRKFLLETSILNNLNESLCSAVTGRNDSQSILEQLESNNMFLQPLDESSRWFHFHPLFRDLLYKQLATAQPEMIPLLHSIASKWFKNQGLTEDAIEHALAAEELTQAADLLQDNVFGMLCKDENMLLIEDWCNKIPDYLLTQKLKICVAGAVNAFAKRQIEDVERYRHLMETMISNISFEYPANNTDNIQSLIKIVCAMDTYHKGDIDNAINLGLESLHSLTSDEQTSRFIIYAVLGVIYWAKGELQTSYNYYREGNNCAIKAGLNHAALIVSMAHINFARGYMKSAEDMCIEATQLAEDNNHREETGISYACLLLGQILYQKNNLDNAANHINRSVDIGQYYQEPAMYINGYLALARINLAQGRTDEAITNIRKARVETYKMDRRYGLIADISITHFLLRQGKIREAVEYSTSWMDFKDNDIVKSMSHLVDLYDVRDIWYESPYITMLRMYLACNELDKMPLLFESVYKQLLPRQSVFHIIECLVLKALFHYSLNEFKEAVDALEEVFALTENEDYIRVFVDEGQPMLDLLKLARSRHVSPHYVRKLIKSFNQFYQASSNEPGNRKHSCSKRESEIILLVDRGLTNKEIADKLTITVATVKSHLFNIYQKLNVCNRKSAILKSREIGLL